MTMMMNMIIVTKFFVVLCLSSREILDYFDIISLMMNLEIRNFFCRVIESLKIKSSNKVKYSMFVMLASIVKKTCHNHDFDLGGKQERRIFAF